MRPRATIGFAATVVLLACGSPSPGPPPRPDAAPPPPDCVSDVDCTTDAPCASPMRCEGGECVATAAPADGTACPRGDGDGHCFHGECLPPCRADGDCADDDPCNGVETCDLARGVCRAGEPLPFGTRCGDPDDPRPNPWAFCMEGVCSHKTCLSPYYCDDGDPCNGEERCLRGRCALGETYPDCSDGVECTDDLCDPATGACVNPEIDRDGDLDVVRGDGCGGDCDDADPTVFRGAPELCDGKDNDCDGLVDGADEPLVWYADCDADGWPTHRPPNVPGCDPPATGPEACPETGRWATHALGAPFDCNDQNSNVFPGQPAFFTQPIPGEVPDRDFDYDCDGAEQHEYPDLRSCSDCCCFGCDEECDDGPGWVWPRPECGEPAELVVSCTDTRCEDVTQLRRGACR